MDDPGYRRQERGENPDERETRALQTMPKMGTRASNPSMRRPTARVREPAGIHAVTAADVTKRKQEEVRLEEVATLVRIRVGGAGRRRAL